VVFLEIARRPPEIADESLRCIWTAKWLPIHSPDKRFDHALLIEGLPGDLTVLQKRAMQGELFDALSDTTPNLESVASVRRHARRLFHFPKIFAQ